MNEKQVIWRRSWNRGRIEKFRDGGSKPIYQISGKSDDVWKFCPPYRNLKDSWLATQKSHVSKFGLISWLKKSTILNLWPPYWNGHVGFCHSITATIEGYSSGSIWAKKRCNTLRFFFRNLFYLLFDFLPPSVRHIEFHRQFFESSFSDEHFDISNPKIHQAIFGYTGDPVKVKTGW